MIKKECERKILKQKLSRGASLEKALKALKFNKHPDITAFSAV